MIIEAGTIQVAAEARAAYLEECQTVMEMARPTPGCLDFAVSADQLEPDRINIYERWETDGHLMAFRAF